MTKRLFATVLGASLLLACARHHSTATTVQEKRIMTKKILIAMTSHDKKGDTGQSTGAYLPEVAHPYDVFTKAGFTVDFASVRGGKVPLDGVDRSDPINAAFLDDRAAMSGVTDSKASDAIDPAKYDAIFFAGGHGTMWDFPDATAFAAAATSIYERGGVVAAVCHGPAALVNVRLSNGAWLVAGKEVSAFTNAEERAVKLEDVVPFLLADRLAERGARMVEAPNWQPKVVVAERLVTGPPVFDRAAMAFVIVVHASRKIASVPGLIFHR